MGAIDEKLIINPYFLCARSMKTAGVMCHNSMFTYFIMHGEAPSTQSMDTHAHTGQTMS